MCDAANKCIVHDRGQNLVIWQMNTKLSLSLLFHACVGTLSVAATHMQQKQNLLQGNILCLLSQILR